MIIVLILESCNNVNITNTMENNIEDGIDIEVSCNDIYLGNANFQNSYYDAIVISSSSNVTLNEININNCLWDDGIDIESSNGVIMTGVTIINMLDDSGISIDASNAVSLNEFKINNVLDDCAIYIDSSNNTFINNGSITNIHYDLFDLDSCVNTSITNTIGTAGDSFGVYIETFSNNTYIGSCTFQEIFKADIYCDDWANITVQNCNFYGDTYGIEAIADSENQNLTVDGCYFANVNEGIYLSGSIPMRSQML